MSRVGLRSAAIALALLCLGIEVALAGADAGLWGSARWRPFAYQNGAFWAGLLADWEPNIPLQPVAMFLSYSLLHGGPWHLAGNLVALWVLLRLLGERLDAPRFLALWAVSATGGGLAFALLAGGVRPMVGASGALFGLAGAWMLWEARDLRARGLSLRPVWRALALVVALHPAMWLIEAGLLAWQAHLGGMVAGAILAAAMGPAGAAGRSGPPQRR